MKLIKVKEISNPKYVYTFEFEKIELALIMMYLNKTGGSRVNSYRAIADNLRNEIISATSKNGDAFNDLVCKLRSTLDNDGVSIIFGDNKK